MPPVQRPREGQAGETGDDKTRLLFPEGIGDFILDLFLPFDPHSVFETPRSRFDNSFSLIRGSTTRPLDGSHGAYTTLRLT